MRDSPKYPVTPDGRYFVVRGRLWRCSNPALSQDEKTRLVHALMDARRRVRHAKDDAMARQQARRDVEAAKRGLGERGPAWWGADEPTYDRCLARNTPYSAWFFALTNM